MSRVVTATYRLQLTREFPLSAVRALVPYFDRLGVSHLYLSPLLAARAGSQHGYDVIDHTRVNPELGSEDDLRALATELHTRGMGIILDVVPNHMAASAENPWWDDVLERGRGSRYASWFDIDWDAPDADGRVVLPVLGDELDAVLERGELALHIRDSGARVAYFERTFPLDAATLPPALQLARMTPEGRPAAEEFQARPAGRERMKALLDAQHYRLASFQQSRDAINWRRFFDVSDLVALRMETDDVFEATHRTLLQWIRDGVIDGLRVDHVDGLRAPSWYLARLRQEVDAARHPDLPEPVPIYVEKILTGDETLAREWHVDGTTGYDFMADVEELFLDPEGVRAIEAGYRGVRQNPSLTFEFAAREGKRRALRESLVPDVARVARVGARWRPGVADEESIGYAVVELIARLRVYRTYVTVPGMLSESDTAMLSRAFQESRECGSADPEALELLRDAFVAPPAAGDALRAELVSRIQQLSGAATAKGVEDTAFYTFVPLASRNEVGSSPGRIENDAASRLHARNAERSRDWPRTMTTTNTHDAKRGGDVRARLDVLSWISGEWGRHVARWRQLNDERRRRVRKKPAPSANGEYLYYQTLLGVWREQALPADRLVAYMIKASREAKRRTSWTEPDERYEKAVEAFVRETVTLDAAAPFRDDVAGLARRVVAPGLAVSLARLLVHHLSPGIPDLYQGDELWNFVLVDPDNRRPVDFERRMALLTEIDPGALLARVLPEGCDADADDRLKLALTATLLDFRRRHPDLVRRGDYVPIESPAGLFAFARRLGSDACIAIIRTRPAVEGIQNAPDPSNSVVLSDELAAALRAGTWVSPLTRRTLTRSGSPASHAEIPVQDLIAARQPCELWVTRTA